VPVPTIPVVLSLVIQGMARALPGEKGEPMPDRELLEWMLYVAVGFAALVAHAVLTVSR